jgi:mono/diheme cytochrome c family protein
MNAKRRLCWLFVVGGGLILIAAGSHTVRAMPPWLAWRKQPAVECPPCEEGPEEWAGTWYWLRSPEEEKRVITSYYNRYCIRCHAVDGRGVWDIPDVPDFTNLCWQASRSDGQLARLILEGRGAVMPAFRGTLTLEEAWAMARYLRTFVPGSEASRPDLREPDKGPERLPGPKPVGPATSAIPASPPVPQAPPSAPPRRPGVGLLNSFSWAK